MQFEVNGIHPAGDMSPLGAAAAALPERSLSSQYPSKFSLVVTTGSMMGTERQSVPCKLFMYCGSVLIVSLSYSKS